MGTKKKLKPRLGDIVELADEGKPACVLYARSGCFRFRVIGEEGNRLGGIQTISQVVERIGRNLEKLTEVMGVGCAVVICQEKLPEGFLEGLSTEQLMDVLGAAAPYDNVDVELKASIHKLLEHERRKHLTPNHVRDVCLMGQTKKTCSFLAGDADGCVFCAKSGKKNQGLAAAICQRRFMETMVAMGDNCIGRQRRVSVSQVSR